MKNVERVKENLAGKFWTRFHEMLEELEELDYCVIWQSHERVDVVDLMDEDEPEYMLMIGHANSTMWVQDVVI